MGVDYADIRVEFDRDESVYHPPEALSVEHPFKVELNDSGRLPISRHGDPVYEFRHVSRYSVSPLRDFILGAVRGVATEHGEVTLAVSVGAESFNVGEMIQIRRRGGPR